jgi:hypothetical protein
MFGNGSDTLVAIPFDFDFSGIVNSPNAVPNAERGVERIGQRSYRGYCVNNAYLEASIDRFQDARDALYSMVADQEELEPSIRESVAAYMDGFYDVADEPAAVQRELIDNCR